MKFVEGDRVMWYDSRLWGPRDVDQNQHCYRPATVVASYLDQEQKPAVDLLFDHNPLVSHGHFAYPPFEGNKIEVS